MTPTQEAAMRQALEALEALRLNMPDCVLTRSLDKRIDALRAALATGDNLSPTEPVAWVECDGELVWNNREAAIGRNLYTAPPQRKPLTREEAIALWADKSDGPSVREIVSFARAVERAHGIGGKDEQV